MAVKMVIKDDNGHFVPGSGAFILTSEGWVYCSFTGKSTGFVYFSNLIQAENEREKLQTLCEQYRFNKKFTIEYIDIQKTVKKGKLIIQNLLVNNKKLVTA